MNPLRLAALNASPFCYAKRGGIEVALKDSFRGMIWSHTLNSSRTSHLGSRPRPGRSGAWTYPSSM